MMITYKVRMLGLVTWGLRGSWYICGLHLNSSVSVSPTILKPFGFTSQALPFYSLKHERNKKKHTKWNLNSLSNKNTGFALFRICWKAPQFLMLKTAFSIQQTSFILSLPPFQGKNIVSSHSRGDLKGSVSFDT